MGRTEVIRDATARDSSPMAKLAGQLGYNSSPGEMRKRLSLLQKNPNHAVFVAQLQAGSVAGWVHVFIRIGVESDSFAEIGGLVVEEARRQAGIGRLLVKASENWARKKGCSSVRVRTNVVRTETHQFYEHMGYVIQKRQTVFQKRLKEKA